MLARRPPGRSSQDLADRVRWSILKDAKIRISFDYRAAGVESSYLEDGKAHHDRFRHSHEQGLRGDRGLPAVPCASAPGGGHSAPAVYNSLDGRIRRWQHPGPVLGHRHEAADSVRFNLSGANFI